MIDPTVAQQLEMLNRTGALAAAFLAGWVCCLISLWTGLRAMRRIRQHRLASRMGPPKGSYGPRRPAPGMQRVYYDMPSTIAECGGPCAAGPEHCDCGALWRDVPKRPRDLLVFGEPVRVADDRLDSASYQQGPAKPLPPPGRIVDAYDRTVGYIPRPQDDTPNPPPEVP